jgi:hypothetical protein
MLLIRNLQRSLQLLRHSFALFCEEEDYSKIKILQNYKAASPTPPLYWPQVLTPRDQHAHRGGGHKKLCLISKYFASLQPIILKAKCEFYLRIDGSHRIKLL